MKTESKEQVKKKHSTSNPLQPSLNPHEFQRNLAALASLPGFTTLVSSGLLPSNIPHPSKLNHASQADLLQPMAAAATTATAAPAPAAPAQPAPPAPATPAKHHAKRPVPPSASPRMRWSDEETLLLYRLDDLIDSLFESANQARAAAHGLPLDLPSPGPRMRALAELLPDVKVAMLTRRYTVLQPGGRAALDKVDLPFEYEKAAQAAAERLLEDAMYDDALGTGTGRKSGNGNKRKGAGEAEDEVEHGQKKKAAPAPRAGVAPLAAVVDGKLMAPEPVHPQPQVPQCQGQNMTLNQAIRSKIKPHRLQRDQIHSLHTSHDLFTWYPCTRQICEWGAKSCVSCDKRRALRDGSLYCIIWGTVRYWENGAQVEARSIFAKFMCPSCAVEHD